MKGRREEKNLSKKLILLSSYCTNFLLLFFVLCIYILLYISGAKERKEGRKRKPKILNASSPVSSGRDEVYAAVDSGVWDPLLPVDVDLLLQVGLVLVVDELHDGLPAGRRGR